MALSKPVYLARDSDFQWALHRYEYLFRCIQHTRSVSSSSGATYIFQVYSFWPMTDKSPLQTQTN